MRKCMLIAAMLLTVVGARSQTNIQVMYDMGRRQLTTTLEMYKGDDWGSTFFFADIYHKFDQTAPTDFYVEIARGLNFWRNTALGALSLHVEWNGVCGIFGVGGCDNWGGYPVKNAWLFGIEYNLHNEDYSNTFTFEVMYKRIGGQKNLDNSPMRPFDKVSDCPVQFTFVWGMQRLFGLKGLVFRGFLDLWGENVNWGYDDSAHPVNTKLVVLAEPQIWYNVGQHFGCDNLCVGGEVELAYNFTGGWKSGAGNKGFTVAPAAGVKWVF